MGWLYALHARSSIARGRAWQAEYVISGLRDQVLALACLRLGVLAVQARGIDTLPPEIKVSMADALVRSLEPHELRRDFEAACIGLMSEIALVDSVLADRLIPTLRELATASRCDGETMLGAHDA